MEEARIEIIVSGEGAQATLDQITSQLPADAVVASASDVQPPSFEELLENSAIASADLPAQVSNWFATVEMNPVVVLAICAAIFVGAYLVERVLRGLFLKGPAPAETGDVGLGLRWGLKHLIGLVIFYIVSSIAIRIALPTDGEVADLATVSLLNVTAIRLWYLIIEFLAASRDSARRPTGLSDSEASYIMRNLMIMLTVMLVLGMTREFIVSVVDAGVSGALLAISIRLVVALSICAFFLSIRKPVGKLIVLGFASDKENPGAILLFLQRFWPAIYIFLLALQIWAEAQGYLTGTLGEGANALKRSFGALVLAPFCVAGLRVWSQYMVSRSNSHLRGRILGVFSLLEGAFMVGIALILMYAWNIDPFATDLTGPSRILPGLVSAAIVTVIGVSAWRTASALLNDSSAAADEDGGIPDGEGGAGGSRIETVLPVLRAVVAGFIGTFTVLLALSSLGVEIAPLLAGAGVLGLAVGFGAQKVVEDIISGVLYLVEDAFRKGEYIETAQGKGVVESIMLRSVRLRHHLGPVFTIPFSAMGTIQNHSRDWVTVKLSFEVAPDVDLEKVRKLVKKVGAQLMDDPELEGQFLAPLKSQGAVALVGANYKIGVKFTSEPGKQFLIRRKALNAIQNAFRENNIQMASPRVIVDTGDGGAVNAAAAKAALDAQATPTIG
jgi:small-conductance mechanosensitive channel